MIVIGRYCDTVCALATFSRECAASFKSCCVHSPCASAWWNISNNCSCSTSGSWAFWIRSCPDSGNALIGSTHPWGSAHLRPGKILGCLNWSAYWTYLIIGRWVLVGGAREWLKPLVHGASRVLWLSCIACCSFTQNWAASLLKLCHLLLQCLKPGSTDAVITSSIFIFVIHPGLKMLCNLLVCGNFWLASQLLGRFCPRIRCFLLLLCLDLFEGGFGLRRTPHFTWMLRFLVDDDIPVLQLIHQMAWRWCCVHQPHQSTGILGLGNGVNGFGNPSPALKQSLYGLLCGTPWKWAYTLGCPARTRVTWADLLMDLFRFCGQNFESIAGTHSNQRHWRTCPS